MDHNEIVRRPIYKSRRLQLGALIFFALIFFVVRISLLALAPSHVFHPSFDETVSGALTCDILDARVSAPLMAYQYESRSGDSLLEGLLLVPFFQFAGRSVFVLKTVCIFSAVATLILWLFFIRRYIGMKAAVIFAAFFIFPPLTFARLNLMGTVASHHLINPCIALQLIVFFRIFEFGKNAAKLWLWCLAGLVAGFGSYLFYTHFIFTFFCAVFLFFCGRSLISPKRLICFAFSFLVGFSPWIYRLIYSTGGSDYLSTILKNLAIDPWRFVQNFGFNLPHSMGYAYPLRAIGLQSVGFTLFFLIFAGFLLGKCYTGQRQTFLLHGRAKRDFYSIPLLVGGFIAAYPVFFLICLSLSPMAINPFEYWPAVGLFGNFGASDLYRYRWLHSLYPFYFSVIAVGASVFTTGRLRGGFARVFVSAVLVFFVIGGLVKIVSLFSLDNAGSLVSYKGYNYDRLANRFLLGDFKLNCEPLSCFPETNRPEVYRCLGAKEASLVFTKKLLAEEVDVFLDSKPLHIQKDYMYGLVNAGQHVLGQGLPVDFLSIAEQYPNIFYEKFGQRYLGYKYFGVLCNQDKFMAHLGSVEKWFFEKEVSRLFEDMNSDKQGFFSELNTIASSEKPAVIKGVGMLVGAEMLFDPLHCIDYPLDSRFGNELDIELRKHFYGGVGAGFAETLCRFWGKLLPLKQNSNLYSSSALELEWERCISLMEMLPEDVKGMVAYGFREELSQRMLHEEVRQFLHEKYKSGW